MYKIHLLPATFGDSILIEYGTRQQPHFILIDGGPYYVFDELWAAMLRVAPNITELELLVITHIDIDHIDGIVKLLNQTNLPFTIKDIWFNGRAQLERAVEIAKDDTLGSLQGEYISILIRDHGYPHNLSFHGEPACVQKYQELPEISLDGGMKIRLLAPGIRELIDLIPVWDKELKGRDIEEEWLEDDRYADTLGDQIETWQELEFEGDDSEANCSSIAFIATYQNKSCLFAGDSPTPILLKGVNALLDQYGDDKLKLDAWKLAHHGSKKSTQEPIMKMLHCKKILVSSDGKRYKHPDAPVIAKLIKHNGPGIHFYFNYKTDHNKMWSNSAWKQNHRYKASYPKKVAEPGISIVIAR